MGASAFGWPALGIQHYNVMFGCKITRSPHPGHWPVYRDQVPVDILMGCT